MIYLAYLACGAIAGFIAGLFGVGGGAVVVPMLIILFGLQGVDSSVLVHMAVATSLASIVITSLSSARAHALLGHVIWPVFRAMLPGLVVGVAIGVFVASTLSGASLQLLIASFLFFVALRMLLSRGPQQGAPVSTPAMVHTAAGGVIGLASAIFGIGGGSLTVPWLASRGEAIKRAVGTSALCGLPIAVVGAMSNMLAGASLEQLPPWSVGYVYLPALLGIAIASAPMAKVGARLAGRMSEQLLQRSFALCLLLVAARLLWVSLV